MRLTRQTFVMLSFQQVPDASVSLDAPSVDVKKPKKSFGFGGMFKKPSVKAGSKVSVLFLTLRPFHFVPHGCDYLAETTRWCFFLSLMVEKLFKERVS